VVSEVGIYDMLRVETTPNGAFNVTEYGTVKEKRSSTPSTPTRRTTA
jgi:prolyl oligopeptidase PreP (S9A serine peptidase family)